MHSFEEFLPALVEMCNSHEIVMKINERVRETIHSSHFTPKCDVVENKKNYEYFHVNVSKTLHK
jgi:hypothetical protein